MKYNRLGYLLGEGFSNVLKNKTKENKNDRI